MDGEGKRIHMGIVKREKRREVKERMDHALEGEGKRVHMGKIISEKKEEETGEREDGPLRHEWRIKVLKKITCL